MVAKIFTVLALSFVAGSCCELTQRFSGQSISIPVTNEPSSYYSVPEFSDNIFSSSPSLPTPMTSENVFSTQPVFSTPVASAPVLSDDIFSSGPSSFSTMVSNNILPIGSSAPVLSNNNVFSASFRPVTVQAINEPELSAAVVPIADKTIGGIPTFEGQGMSLSPKPESEPVVTTRCFCTKTFVRPQIYQRTVIVPKIQRFLKRTVTPVVETVAYKSQPKSSVLSSVDLPSSDDSSDYQSKYSSYAPLLQSSRLVSPSSSSPCSNFY